MTHRHEAVTAGVILGAHFHHLRPLGRQDVDGQGRVDLVVHLRACARVCARARAADAGTRACVHASRLGRHGDGSLALHLEDAQAHVLVVHLAVFVGVQLHAEGAGGGGEEGLTVAGWHTGQVWGAVAHARVCVLRPLCKRADGAFLARLLVMAFSFALCGRPRSAHLHRQGSAGEASGNPASERT